MSSRPQRAEVPLEQTWDLHSLYPSLGAWESDVARAERDMLRVDRFRGRLSKGASVLLEFLRFRDELRAFVEQIQWFASNSLSEDVRDSQRQACAQRATALSSAVQAAFAPLESELLDLPEEKLVSWIASMAELRPYQRHLTELVAQKGHRLSTDTEAAIAQLGEVLQTPVAVWRAIVNHEMRFPPVTDTDGTVVPMSLPAVYRLLKSPDRGVRKAAYEAANAAFAGHRQTLAIVFAAACRRNVQMARLRRYPSALAAAVEPAKLSEAMVHQILEASQRGACHYQRYLQVRKRAMHLDELMPWDLYSPLVKAAIPPVSFDEAYETVTHTLTPLGPDYRGALERIRRERWIDWADNVGKRGETFASNCYRHRPAVMITWQGTPENVLALAHELGHAVHWLFSSQEQPYVYAHPPLFLAETAATANEVFMVRHLLQTTTQPALRRQVLVLALNSLTQNFFWGSKSTAFQVKVHEMAARGEPLTEDSITAAHTEVLQRWHGQVMKVTPEGDGCTWTWIPHHFTNFYAYQYAMGIALAVRIADGVLSEGASAAARYLDFLRTGSSQDPADLLKRLGVDLELTSAYDRFLALYEGLVDELALCVEDAARRASP